MIPESIMSVIDKGDSNQKMVVKSMEDGSINFVEH